GVTIFISTHYMSEAARCDRISLMHAGRVLISGTPKAIRQGVGAATLNDAFVHHLEQAVEGGTPTTSRAGSFGAGDVAGAASQRRRGRVIAARRLGVSWRVALELRRAPIRLTLACAGSVMRMIVLGYGISMDVENLKFAALDLDQSIASQA